MDKIAARPRWYVTVTGKRGVKWYVGSRAETKADAGTEALLEYRQHHPELVAGDDFWVERVETWGAYVARVQGRTA